MPTAAETDDSTWRLDRLEHERELDGLARIAIVNERGGVKVRAWDRPVVQTLGIRQMDVGDPRRPEVVWRLDGDELEISADYSEALPEGAVEGEGWDRRRIDLTVVVPRHVAVSVRTVSELAEVRGVDGDVRLESSTGELRARVGGRLDARSQHGAVLAQFLRTAWSGPSLVETKTGPIRVELPNEPVVEVDLETHAEVTSDYSLTIERREGSLFKRGHIALGAGGERLQVRSDRGAIAIVTMLVPQAPPSTATVEDERDET